MLSYLVIGANDVAQSARFYAAILLPIGYQQIEQGTYAAFALKDAEDKENGPGTIWIEPPFDGRPATFGNGMMPAFRTKSRAEVRALHAAAMAHGGTDEGGPGLRPHYGPSFYAAYMRDPVGNKLAAFCTADEA
jgi:catechol 2,3-dioxygenase-like lactoylglutathione lyase family enzyme